MRPRQRGTRSRHGARKSGCWCRRQSRSIEHVIQRVPVGDVDVGGCVPGHGLQPQTEGSFPPARVREARAQGVLDESGERDPVPRRPSLGLAEHLIVQIERGLHRRHVCNKMYGSTISRKRVQANEGCRAP